MFGWKVYLNYFLWRFGLRHILPAPIISKVSVHENGEPLVDFDGHLMRVGVRDRLARAASELAAHGLHIKILSAYRSMDEQKKLWTATGGNSRYVANPDSGGGGHQTGAALDVTLVDASGREVDMGGKYLVFDAATPTHAIRNKNRRILLAAMENAGFVNYPNEWWHFSRGDKMWAAYSRRNEAVYGAIE